jgi:large subunit ribosomal protein L53
MAYGLENMGHNTQITMRSGLTESATEDGKEMKLDCEAMGIKSIVEEVDRHSRMLQKEQDLANA